MKILWFTWKDMTHPWAGGAELVNERLAERLVADGHEVTLLVGGYPGCKPEEVINGYKVIRVGGFYSVFWHAFRYYRKQLRDWPDLIIEEVNTLPFFTRLYAKQTKVLFYHQLCREVWFYQMKQPFSLIGYLLEPIYLKLLHGMKAVTISESSKQDMIHTGFNPKDISIIHVGIDIKPLDKIVFSNKSKLPTVLLLGSMRPMKRTLDQVKAFEIAKRHIPSLQLILAGDSNSTYGRRVLRYVEQSQFADDIKHLGRVTNNEKISLMRQSHLLLGASIKEGWGLTITEAASQGTPAAVYDIDGLRDSTHAGSTGIIALQNTPHGLAKAILLALQTTTSYKQLSQRALEESRNYTFDACYHDFKIALADLPVYAHDNSVEEYETSISNVKELIND